MRNTVPTAYIAPTRTWEQIWTRRSFTKVFQQKAFRNAHVFIISKLSSVTQNRRLAFDSSVEHVSRYCR